MNILQSYYTHIPLISSILLGLLSLYLFFNSKKNPSIFAFGLFCLFMAVWQFDYYSFTILDDANAIYEWRRFPR
ncbi:hypothetical protein KKB18_02660, partial [bacterium]|nr:hypothetical protein [bacterium]